MSRARRWLRILSWCTLLLISVLAARQVQAYVASDRRFLLAAPRWSGDRAGGVTIEGSVYSNQERISRAFQADFGRSVLLIPLAERRRRLLAIDWLEDASVSRVWPNQIVVRVTERRPVAFVNFPLDRRRPLGSRVFLIDSEGVLLEQPPKARFAFPVLNGISAEQTEQERRERVQSMLRMLDEIGPLAREISEVDVSRSDNLSVIAKAEERIVELVLGDRNFSRRLRNFSHHYPEIRKRTPDVTTFDLRLDDRITAKE